MDPKGSKFQMSPPVPIKDPAPLKFQHVNRQTKKKFKPDKTIAEARVIEAKVLKNIESETPNKQPSIDVNYTSKIDNQMRYLPSIDHL